MRKLTIILLAILLLLTACKPKKIECSTVEALTLVKSIYTSEVVKTVTSDPRLQFGEQEIASALAKIGIDIGMITTTKSDSSSSKIYCKGELKISIPPEMKSQINALTTDAKVNSIDARAAQLGFRNADGSSSIYIDYDIQPTDDMKTIYVQSNETDRIEKLLLDAVELYLSKPLIDAKVAADKKQIEENSIEASRLEKESKLENQKTLLESAKKDNLTANKAINEVWANLPPEERKNLLPEQKSWIGKKDKNCKPSTAQDATDPIEREIFRLTCDTQETESRIDYLNNQLK